MYYKILINDRDYQEWSVYESETLTEVKQIDIDPSNSKLFSCDIFEVNNNNNIIIIHSSIRLLPSIPGCLILQNSKTYGKYKDKYLYKCIPDDKRIPIFLIPYKLKLGFSKNINNKYIVFKFNNWDGKHPQGTIVNILGDVNILSNYYEYQLYCRSLYASIQNFNKATTNALKKEVEEKFITDMIQKYNLIDRTHEQIYSIDSKETSDYDDAFSVTELGNDSYNISIYIANVSLWMEDLNLWNSFSERISTIYLPDRKRPMLPLSLSNCLCSLCENVVRVAFTLDLTIIKNEIIGYKFENTYIKVYKNHIYESTELLKDNNYKQLFNIVNKLSKVYKYTLNIKGSHDIVSYLMILMNYYTAIEMVRYNNGIFRSVKMNTNNNKNPDLPDNVNNFIKIWNSSCGQYNLYNDREKHEMLELESYIHCTSPIRRLVDLLNIAKLQQNLLLVDYSSNFNNFYKKWCDKLDYINTTMRAIRKIQHDCNLLEMCTNNPNIFESEYEGYVFDKIVRNDGLYQYIVYLTELKIVSRITLRTELEDYSKNTFKIFIFQDESAIKKKIRLSIM